MIRPDNLEIYESLDLKLGIKSSLPEVKSTIALLILLWESNDRPDMLKYSEQQNKSIVIPAQLKSNLINFIYENVSDFKIIDDKFEYLINSNKLYTSQMESLIVAFELIWRLGKFSFVDKAKPSSAERTGLNRYPKEIYFSSNLDLIHSVISNNFDEFIKVLIDWLGYSATFEQNYETTLLIALQVFTEGSIYKLNDNGKSIIFNQNSIYNKLLDGNEKIDINGDSESKGPLRVLKSALNEKMNPYLEYNSGAVSVNPELKDRFVTYQKRVETFLKLSTTDFTDLREFLIGNKCQNGTILEKTERLSGGENILLYGVPGSGKSYTIEQEYCNDESKIERIVFHPDYMNTDFIGQILPTIKEDKTITYEFTPGPFTRIVEKSYKNPSDMFYLIIEEINRGNAPAIFGDVFQLLDRNKSGESSYSIKNHNVAEIVYGDPEHTVSIPSNLSILATMNTADLNVFTLDTAFQRRWVMRLIKNDVSKAEHAKVEILDTGVTWEIFNNTINDFILANNASTMSSEDKRLGAYFITRDILESKDESKFAEKVIKYLWDDAFKFARNKLFEPSYRSLEKVIDDFADFSGFERFNIFTSEVKEQLRNKVNINQINLTDSDSEEKSEE